MLLLIGYIPSLCHLQTLYFLQQLPFVALFRKYKSQDVVTDLLPVLDNFERALQTEVAEESKGFVDGIKMVYNQLVEALENHGVEAIEAVGAEFDPNLHHAV